MLALSPKLGASLLPPALALLLTAGAAPPAPASAQSPTPPPAEPNADLPQIRFEKYALPNGVEVILHEDHRIPEVAVDVWYKVGSKDEADKRTGFAHLFEHVMFQGSKHVPEDKHFEYLQKAGVSNANGSTGTDRTNYFEVVPANQLELALWLESDRMGFLLDRPGFKETIDVQRDVVKNERRQRIENRPMGLVERVELEALFPPTHPYHHEVIGSMEDLSAASVDDVKAFFRTYYVPNNACLVIAGDFDSAKTKALVEKYFGPIPRGGAIPRREATLPNATSAPAVAMEAKVQQPQVTIAFVTPANFAPGDRELDVIANVLGNGKSSRLFKRLVYDMKIAQNVTASQDSLMLASEFEIVASPMPGHTLGELMAVIDEEVAKLQQAPVDPAELERAKNQIESANVRALEPLIARAERLQHYNYLMGDPGYLAEDVRRYREVDAAAVQNAAQRYLRPDNRVVITVEPNPDAPIMGRVVKK
jgi:predicted Zn-dependent peptidase